jgi:hypothetical protein
MDFPMDFWLFCLLGAVPVLVVRIVSDTDLQILRF